MAKNTLEIIIKANATQAQQALKGLQNTIGKPFAGLKQSVGQLGTAFTSLTGFSLGAAGAFAAVGMAASKASDFIKDSVTSTVAYAQSVRELSYVLGTNAEETSKIIQVADDYLISTEKLSTALRFAVKNGFEPSIDSLARLADQFNSISDPNERAAKMVEIFGRNWSALVPLLKAGGAAIRENASAINDALILSDAQVQATFEYQQALNNLDDSVNAIKTSIGMALVPSLNDALGVVNKLTPALNLLDDVMAGNVITVYSLVAAVALFSGKGLGLENLADSAKLLNAAFEETQAQAGRTAEELSRMKQDLGGVTDEVDDATDAFKALFSALSKSGKFSANEIIAQMDALSEATGGASAASVIYTADMQLLTDAIAAGILTQEQYIPLLADTADGIFELTPAMRDYIEQSIAAREETGKLTKSIEAAGNAATVLQDKLGLVFGRTERWEGPRQRAEETFQALKDALLLTTDPQEIVKRADAVEKFGLAFGFFTEKGLAIEQAQIDFEQLLPQVIDPVKAQAALEAAFRGFKPGMVFDVTQILRDAGLLPDDSVAVTIRDEWSRVLTDAFTGIGQGFAPAGGMGGGTGGASGPGNPAFQLLSNFLPTQSDVDKAAAPLMELPTNLIGAFAVLSGGEEGGSTIATPIQAIATATGDMATNIINMNEPLAAVAINAGTLGINAKNADQPMKDLDTNITNVGDSAGEKAGAMEELVGFIQDLTPAASAATGAVAGLARAINSLQSKTITITVNYVENMGGLGFGAPAPGPRVRRRAAGGKVDPLEDYIVGEKGPELFIPSQAGTIIPANITQAAIMAAATGGGDIGAFNRPQPTPQERRAERALQNAVSQTYKPFRSGSGNLLEPAPTTSQYETGQVATASTETERMGQNVTYNSYFPIQRVDDELDARELARLVAAELARMPSR